MGADLSGEPDSASSIEDEGERRLASGEGAGPDALFNVGSRLPTRLVKFGQPCDEADGYIDQEKLLPVGLTIGLVQARSRRAEDRGGL